MATDIYYFTGTGNSLYVAKELQKRMPDARVIPLVSLLKRDKIETSAETLGIVFPLHGMTLPIPLRIFLRKADFSPSKFLFAVSTRGGTKCLAFEKIDKLLKRQGRKLDSSFILTMENNDPKFETYPIPTAENFRKIEAGIKEKLDDAAVKIASQMPYREPDTDFIDFPYNKTITYLLERLILFGMWAVEKNVEKHYFYADSKCTGCGSCSKVCPSEKIAMEGKVPVWKPETVCYFCYACLNYCPAEAVQIKSKWYMKSYTEQNGRYPHPYATAKDIAAQKQEAL